jgi:LCP family protein required for cell wall assembly
LTVLRQDADVAGTQRIRVSCGGLGRAALAGAGAASASNAAAAVDVKRFTTRPQQARRSEVPGVPLGFSPMSWRRNRTERPPRVGVAVLAKALAGVLVIFIATGAGVAGAGYFQIPVPKPDPGKGPVEPPIAGITDKQIEAPEPGQARTLLVLGSDRRAKNSIDAQAGQRETPHSDTIVLIRLDPKRNRIAVLSLPRDLAVTIPGYADNTKINQAYDEGGAAKTLETVKYMFENATGEKFPVNSVIDVSFNGFQQAVNYVKGVYVDVDRDYYNPEGTGFAAIDIKAGYQRLVGSDALAYVRYRHADSDIFRNARQQEFLRQASNQPAVENLKSADAASNFLNEIIGYFRFDKKFLTRKNIAGLIKTGVSLAYNHAPVNQIRLDGITEADNPIEDTRLYISNDELNVAFDAFMTGEGTRNPKRVKQVTRVKKAAKASTVSGLENARRVGEDIAVRASRRLKTLPFYFPAYRTTGSRYVNETPRIYSERDDQGHSYRAYRIVISNGAPGEYYGVQGQTWRDPPLLANPDRIREVNGRELMLFYDGSKLRQVAWRTSRAVYWVTNTLNRKITNTRMIAIAASLRRL